jgi:hypothetical protein
LLLPFLQILFCFSIPLTDILCSDDDKCKSLIEPRLMCALRQQLPPIANAGVSRTVNENTRVTLDGRASYSPTGNVVVGYQWTQLATIGVPVILTGADTATPTLITPTVPSDTVLAFSLRIMDNHGAISSNPSIVYLMVKHHVAGGTTSSTPTTGFHINQQQQPPPQLPKQQHSPIITTPNQQLVK